MSDFVPIDLIIIKKDFIFVSYQIPLIRDYLYKLE